MVNWIKTDEFISYPDALERMEQIVSGLISGDETEHIWLLQHPELYTAGTSANSSDLVDPDLFPFTPHNVAGNTLTMAQGNALRM